MLYVDRVMIVPAALLTQCRALVGKLATEPVAQGMWIRGASPTGEALATHYVSSGATGVDFAAMMPLTTYTTDAEGVETGVTEPGAVDTIVALSEGAVTAEQLEALFSAVTVTNEPSDLTLQRMGLKLINETPEATT